MSDDYSGPCRTCGSAHVGVHRVPAERSLADSARTTVDRRICENPDCPTNNPREKGLTDVV